MNTRIKELEDQIRGLRYKKILKGTLLDILKEKHDEIEKVNQLKNEITVINAELEPLNKEFDNLHNHYYIVFESEMLDPLGQTRTKYEFKKVMYSQIDCNIDTTTETRSHTDIPNYMDLLDELAFRLSNEYSNVWFKVVKKIRTKTE